MLLAGAVRFKPRVAGGRRTRRSVAAEYLPSQALVEPHRIQLRSASGPVRSNPGSASGTCSSPRGTSTGRVGTPCWRGKPASLLKGGSLWSKLLGACLMGMARFSACLPLKLRGVWSSVRKPGPLSWGWHPFSLFTLKLVSAGAVCGTSGAICVGQERRVPRMRSV